MVIKLTTEKQSHLTTANSFPPMSHSNSDLLVSHNCGLSQWLTHEQVSTEAQRLQEDAVWVIWSLCNQP